MMSENMEPHHADEERKAAFHWWLRARDLEEENQLAQALVCIERYRQVDSDSKFSNLMYGRILTGLRRFADAKAALSHVLPVNKPTAKSMCYNAWGELCSAQGDYAEAETWYRRLVELEPRQTTGWLFLGSCLVRQGKLHEAEEIYRHATALEGDPAEAFYNLGLIFRAQNRLNKAVEELRLALNLEPHHDLAKVVLEDVLAAQILRDLPL